MILTKKKKTNIYFIYLTYVYSSYLYIYLYHYNIINLRLLPYILYFNIKIFTIH